MVLHLKIMALTRVWSLREITCPVTCAGSDGRRNTSESFDPTALLLREPTTVDANLDRAVFLFELNDFGP